MASLHLATITDIGIKDAIQAGTAGPLITMGGFRIGTLSAADGSQALPTDTDVDGFIYQGTLDQMTYSAVDDNACMFQITLDTSVGDFYVGNIGLILEDGTMFAKVVLTHAEWKESANPPQIVGNRRTYSIVIVLSAINSLINVSVLTSAYCSLPVVPTEFQLPNPNSAPYNAYLVTNHTELGEPCIATRRNGVWDFFSSHPVSGAGKGILAAPSGVFDLLPIPGDIVSLDPITNLFYKADPNVDNRTPVGIMTSTYEVVTLGPVKIDTTTRPVLIPFKFYYADTGVNAGKLTLDSVVTSFPMGFSLSPNRIFVATNLGFNPSNFSDLISIEFLNILTLVTNTYNHIYNIERVYNDLIDEITHLNEIVNSITQIAPLLTQTFYVDANLGNDANNGSAPAAKAFRTLQACVNFVVSLTRTIGNAVIYIADGTYAPFVIASSSVGNWQIIGNKTTPGNVSIRSTGLSAAQGFGRGFVVYGSNVVLTGVKFQTVNYEGIVASNGAKITFGFVEFGACGVHIGCYTNSFIFINGNYTISGGTTIHYSIADNSSMAVGYKDAANAVPVTVTITGNPNFSAAFASVSQRAGLTINSSAPVTFSGSATGTKFNIDYIATVSTAGAGIDYFPGSVAGVIGTHAAYYF